jgi:hypothetical protein
MAKSSPEMAKTYKSLIETYRTQIQELEDKLFSHGMKPKGIKDKSIFEGKPVLSVSIQKSIGKRPTLDSIRMYWQQVSDSKCEQLVEEKGYVVGVINNVIMGVVQVSGWRRHDKREGEDQSRVEFMGELLSDHPSIGYTLKDRSVSGPVQFFPSDKEDS